MNKEKLETFIHYSILGIILIMFLSGIFIIVYYFNTKNNECFNNPLVFASKKYTEQVGYEFYGIGYFRVPPNTVSPIVTFNSSDFSLLEP